jgi:hypothetical protein
VGKSLSELMTELKDEQLPTISQELDELPTFGTFTPPPPPGSYRFQLPQDLGNIWDVMDVPEKTPPQRVRAYFDRDHPLLIVQSPGGKLNGEPFETRLTNNERSRGKDKSVTASDLDYLLRALGEKLKPKSNTEYIRALQKYAGKQFGADIRYSWKCSKDRDVRARDAQGQVTVLEGRKGCGESYYQESRNAAGEVPYEITCQNCGAWLRAFANLDNLRS